jgi:hypothetical protein
MPTVKREDGHIAAHLADVNGDGHLDLILPGYRNAGIEVYFGKGMGNRTLHTTFPETRHAASGPGCQQLNSRFVEGPKNLNYRIVP